MYKWNGPIWFSLCWLYGSAQIKYKEIDFCHEYLSDFVMWLVEANVKFDSNLNLAVRNEW